MRTAKDNFTQFRGDGGGDRAGGIEQVPGNDAGIAAGHEHNHGFANCASEPERHCRKNTRDGGRQDYFPGGFPF